MPPPSIVQLSTVLYSEALGSGRFGLCRFGSDFYFL